MELKKVLSVRNLFLLVLLLAVITTGCGLRTVRTYSGGELPKEKIAVIRGSLRNPLFSQKKLVVSITKIDDGELLKYSGPYLKYEVVKYEVMPGLHKVVVRIWSHSSGGFPIANVITRYFCLVTLEFNAEAGHEYKIEVVDIMKDKAFVVVTDTNSEAVVHKKGIAGESHVPFWFNPDRTIEQTKNDYSECRNTRQEKLCMEAKGYTWWKCGEGLK